MLLSGRKPMVFLPALVCISWLLVWYSFDDIQLWRVPGLHIQTEEETRIAELFIGKSKTPYTEPAVPHANLNISKSSKEWFVRTAAATLPEGDFDGKAIQEVCNQTEIWDPFLTFDCLGVEGGIGNVKQIFLSCLRYAIDAGAGLIVPQINTRDANDLISLESGKTDMSYLFDRELMLARIRTSCPQMPIYETRAELGKKGKITAVIPIAPREMNRQAGLPENTPNVVSVKEHPDLQKNRAPVGKNTVVELLITLAYFSAFVNTFGQLVPFRKDIERLAASALYELSRRYNITIDPSEPISKNAYLGVHLRTDADAVKMGWPTYAENAARFLFLAVDTKLPVMYVASGDALAIESLGREASLLTPPVPVVTKFDLLNETDASLLRSMSWDQQALVDYLMLLKASYFGGMTESSFSWDIAVRRRILSMLGTCGTPNHWRLPKDTVLKDEFTDLLGSHGSDWESNMWP